MKINKKVYRGLSLFLLLFTFIPFNNCSSGFRSVASTNASTALGSSGSAANPGGAVVPPSNPVNPPVLPPVNPPVTPPVASGKVQVFMATGKIARSVISCDDGVTWINDRSDDNNAKCWANGDPNYVECDHDSRSNTGADASDDGWFYAQFGWGYNGSVRKTRDGVNWQTVRSGGWGGGVGVAFNFAFSQFEYNGAVSKDGGVTWSPSTKGFGEFDHPFISRVNNKLIALGRGAGQLAVSLDSGDTWKVANNWESGWGGSFAEGNGIIVGIGSRSNPDQAYASRSLDGGITWSAVAIPNSGGWNMPVLFTGTEFISWGWNGKVLKSKDAVTWTSTDFMIDGKTAPYWSGTVSRNPQTGTYVSIIGNWGAWYASQTAIRSADGVNWTSLDSTHFKGGHPIGKIITGQMDASACAK